MAQAWVGVACLGCLILLVVALWLLWGRRDDLSTEATGGPGPWRRAQRWRAGLTEPTRLVLGLCALAVAWHGAAYSTGWRVFALSVPIEHAPWLALTIVAIIGGTLGLDWLERRPDATP